MNKEIWLNQIEAMVDVLERKGYKVFFNTDDTDRVIFEDREVFINSRNHPENRFYTILHEYGHIMIGETWPKFQSEHPMYVHSPEGPVLDGRHERSHAYRVSLVAEEIEAWKLGRRFARAMGFYVDDAKYDKHMTLNVMSYIDWAAE